MAPLTPLSTIISRMQGWQFASSIEEQYLVRFLDDSIRALRRNMVPPWARKKTTLRVFDDVTIYPTADDHNSIIYLDRKQQNTSFGGRARFVYTSLQEFEEDPTNRNNMAEIWHNGTLQLGVRYKDNGAGSQTIDNAENASRYTASGDASAITLDQVIFTEGNGSIRFTVTDSTHTATITCAPQSFSDTNYQRKYFFLLVYLDSVPTSITLKFGNDASNYLTGSVTQQFSGASFVADDWNLVALDLNTATTTGTLVPTAFDYWAMSLVGAATGTYYVDASYLRGWSLLDYWYGSTFNVATVGQTAPNQDYFFNSSEVYSTDSQLVGDSEWVDVIMYDALDLAAADKENVKVETKFTDRRAAAWEEFETKFPDLSPVEITTRWRMSAQSSEGLSRD